MELIISNVIDQELLGQEAISFCKERGFDLCERVNARYIDITLEFSPEEITKNDFLQKLFNSQTRRCLRLKPGYNLYDLEKSGSIKLSLEKIDKDDNENNRYGYDFYGKLKAEVQDKYFILDYIQKIINDINNVELYRRPNLDNLSDTEILKCLNNKVIVGDMNKYTVYDPFEADLESDLMRVQMLEKFKIQWMINSDNTSDTTFNSIAKKIDREICMYIQDNEFLVYHDYCYWEAKNVVPLYTDMVHNGMITKDDCVYLLNTIKMHLQEIPKYAEIIKEIDSTIEKYKNTTTEEKEDIKSTDNQFFSIMQYIKDNFEDIKSRMDQDYYTPKYMLWIYAAKDAKLDDFKYIRRTEVGYYYDLVTVRYFDVDYAIPVSILADWLRMEEGDILSLIFNNKPYYDGNYR